jgi:N-acyl-D-amino-acid deacylase
MHDLVIKNGTVVDGTGREKFSADISIDEGTITEVGAEVGAGRLIRGAQAAPRRG